MTSNLTWTIVTNVSGYGCCVSSRPHIYTQIGLLKVYHNSILRISHIIMAHLRQYFRQYYQASYEMLHWKQHWGGGEGGTCDAINAV